MASVKKLNLIEGGSGYPSDARLRFDGGGGGSGASAAVSFKDGVITAVTLLDGGSGYSVPPNVVVVDRKTNNPVTAGSGAKITAELG